MNRGTAGTAPWARLASEFRRSVLFGEGMLYVAFIVLIVIFSLTSPVFLTVSNFANMALKSEGQNFGKSNSALEAEPGEFWRHLLARSVKCHPGRALEAAEAAYPSV